ncbi:MAG: hypothetical protein ACO32I_04780 [Candidatus Limnocylindrus sp.]
MDTANQIIYAYGAGRDHRTKYDRRMGRFLARQFRIGDVVIRPGRRVPVTVRFLASHVDEVVRHIGRGALRLQGHADAFIGPEELQAIVRGDRPVLGVPAEAAPDQDFGPGEEEPYAEDPVEEYSEPAPVEEYNEPPADDFANEPEPPLSEEPFEETPDVTSEEMAYMSGPALPEAWRTRNKRGLLALCSERGVAADDKMANTTIIQLLSDWEKAQAAG